MAGPPNTPSGARRRPYTVIVPSGHIAAPVPVPVAARPPPRAPSLLPTPLVPKSRRPLVVRVGNARVVGSPRVALSRRLAPPPRVLASFSELSSPLLAFLSLTTKTRLGKPFVRLPTLRRPCRPTVACLYVDLGCSYFPLRLLLFVEPF